MRPFKTLLALAISLVAISTMAATASAEAPSIEVSTDAGQPTSFTITGELHARGLQTDVWVNYFPKVATTNCTSSPDPGDMLNMQASPAVTVTSDLNQWQMVPVTVTGLPNETEYCFQLAARNIENDESTTLMWFTYTTSTGPELANASFDAGTGTFDYSVDLTPNTNWYFAYIYVDYFEKVTNTCGEHTGVVFTHNDWGPGDNGWQGFAPFTDITATVFGLDADTTYCARIRSDNGHDETSTSWSEFTTVQPTQATATDISLSYPLDGADDAQLAITLDDHGAAADEGDYSEYDIMFYNVGAGRCNSADYAGGPQLFGWGGEFAGEENFSVGVDNLTLGTAYCVTVVIDSAWGSAYDTMVHQEVWFGSNTSVNLGGADTTHDTISMVDANIDAGSLAADYGLQFFVKQSGVTCYDDFVTPRSYTASGTLVENLDDPQLVDFTVGGFTPETTYCVRIKVESYWSEANSSWTALTTKKQPVKATITNTGFGPPNNSERDVAVFADVDEKGAAADTGNISTWQVQHFELPSSSCNAAGIVGQTALGAQAQSFNGEAEVDWDLDPTDPGDEICVRIGVDSAWSGMDEEKFLSFIVPGPPTLSNQSLSSTKTSITGQASLAATWTPTTYYLEYATATDVDCDVLGPVQSTSDQTFTPNTAAGTITATQESLPPDTLYCARFRSSNAYSLVNGLPFAPIRTVEATAPSVPTGLAASNVTQTGATLSWTASTDVAGVDSYRVFEGATEVFNGSATSFAVALTCGQSRTFTVTAVDVNDNESDASAPFTVTASACPPPPSTPSAPDCNVLSAPAKTTIKGKVTSKRKSSKFTIAVSTYITGMTTKTKTKITGVSAAKVKFKFNGKKVKSSPTLTGEGTLTVTYPKGKKTATKKIQIRLIAC